MKIEKLNEESYWKEIEVPETTLAQVVEKLNEIIDYINQHDLEPFTISPYEGSD